MKNLLTYFLLLFCLSVFAQDKAKRFSVGMEVGLTNSYLNIPEEFFYGCYCCFGDCLITPIPTGEDYYNLPHPTYAKQAAIMFNYQLNKRHQIGLGFSMSQYGESHLSLGAYKREVVDFMGVAARYRYKLLDGKRMDFSIANAINLEFPKATEIPINTHKGLSHTAGVTLSYSIWTTFELELGIVGKTALTKYADNAWSGKNNRFGYGAMLGLVFKV